MQEPNEILQDNAETYRQKENDYGASWKLAGETLQKWSGGKPVVLETPEDYIAFGLFTRRLDKVIRSFNLEFLQDDDPTFESIVDSHSDESTYAAMHASLLAGLGTTEYVVDPDDIADAIDPAVTDGGENEVSAADVDPEYEDAFQKIRGGDY